MATDRARRKIRKRKARRKIRKRKKKTTIRATTTTTTKKIILNTDPAPQPQAVRTGRGSGDDKPPVPGRRDMVHQAAQTAADGQRRRGCSICGGRPHNDYFCAYNYMHGFLIARNCAEYCSPGRHAMAAQDSLRRFVRVTNVPLSLDDIEIRWLFQRFGPLRNCYVSRARPEGGTGFGFVTFESRADAEEAIDELNGHRVGDRRLRVDWAYPRA